MTASGDYAPVDYAEVLPGIAREIEAYAAASGWDQPSRLFALVDTEQLLVVQPELAEALADGRALALTPIEQEPVAGTELEELLAGITWPDRVAGAAAVVERVVLPPEADADVPDDPELARSWAQEHPDRQEVRLVAAVARGGSAYCALRMRAHDDPTSVVTGPDLVPALVAMLHATFEEE
ncbi:MAG: PPA1309 family protein [Nocardioides sp.]